MLVGSVLAGSLSCAGAHAEQVLNAHYEINVTDHGAANRVRSTFRLKPGESERLELYPNTVELTVEPISNREYDLQVIVSSKKQPTSTASPKKQSPSSARLIRTFRGTYGVPLELSSGDGAVQVSGAISVVVLEDNRA
jgi:hypothetical protein